jgi:hypothetical protein
MIKKSISDDYHVMTNIDKHSGVLEAIEWCIQNVQPCDPEGGNLYDKRGWAFERFHYSTNFVFIREKDAFAFALRFQ